MTQGLSDPARFEGVESLVQIVAADAITAHPRYGQSMGSSDLLAVAPFSASTEQKYQRLSFTGIAKKRDGRRNAPDTEDERSGSGHNDDDQIISIRSGYCDADTKPGVEKMPMARLTGGTYFGKVMHSIYEKVDFAAVDLHAEVERVASAILTGSSLRRSRSEIVDGVELSLQTPLGGPFGDMTLSAISKDNRLNELSFEMGLASAEHDVTVSDMGRVLVKVLNQSGRGDDILMPYAKELSSKSFEIPLVGLMNGSIDTLIRVGPQGGHKLYVTDWKSNRLDKDGVETMIQGYDRESMLAEMVHHHYPLQALIYGTAVHRYIRSRSAGNAPTATVEGLAYFFIRGMVGQPTPRDAHGNQNGVFTWQAPSGLWAALSDVISGIAA